MTHTNAIVLLSGGIDSATCLAIACDGHDTVGAVHIDYRQQTNDVEADRARRLADHYGVELTEIDYGPLLASLDRGTAGSRESFAGETESDGRSTGYVPMRNLHLLATAGAHADVVGATALYIGVQGGDDESYPDCREPFVRATQRALSASMADDESMDVVTPLIDRSKPDVIRLAADLGVPLEYTYSCYRATDPDDPTPCGVCPACVERIDAFDAAGIDDPILS